MKTDLKEFLHAFNEAYARSDSDYIIGQVEDSIEWTMVGGDVIKGMEAFEKATREMESWKPMKLIIENIIIQGNKAAVNGTMTSEDPQGKIRTYSFCDIYEVNAAPPWKIRSMKSFVMEARGAD
jgi:hypothetical protein